MFSKIQPSANVPVAGITTIEGNTASQFAFTLQNSEIFIKHSDLNVKNNRNTVRLLEDLKSSLIKKGMTAEFAKVSAKVWAENGGVKLTELTIEEQTNLIVALWNTTINHQKIADIGSPSEGLSAWEVRRRAKLPDRAVTYAEGKQPGDNVLKYYERVWGSYRDAKVLYRDDIARLGDEGLVKKVRAYCVRHNLNPDRVLPPPATQRTLDELAETPKDSRDAKQLALQAQKRRWIADKRAKAI